MVSGEVVKVDVGQQKAMLSKVDALLDAAREGNEKLSRTYVEIGLALDEVENAKAWILVARSYDSYIKEHCEPRFGKSRTQLYSYRSIAKNLLPSVPKSDLIEMGVTKAHSLAQYARFHDGKLPANLVKKALDSGVGIEEFEAAVAENQHGVPEKGKWYQIPGFFVSGDEREEIERGLSRAAEIEPLPDNCPDWLKTKIQVQRVMAEFLSTYPETV